MKNNEMSQGDLLGQWLSIAESQTCALEVLSEQMPQINKLLETDMTNLSEHFSKLSQILGDQKALVESLSENNNPNLQSVVNKFDERYKAAMDCIAKITIAMQFQDRVSQNIVICTDVMKVIAGNTLDAIETTLNNFEHAFKQTEKRKRVELDIDFAKKVIEKLWLGELRNKFVNHLVQHGYIASPEQIGHKITKQETDDVDLF